MSRWAICRGFTLIEMLVCVVILLTVTGSVFAVLNPARGAFVSQSAAADLQQQLRVGTETLRHELLMAGAGSDSGAARGPLYRFVAPIIPRRVGFDSPETVREDAVTLIYVPKTVAQASFRDPIAPGAEVALLKLQPGCPEGDAACGFKVGAHVLLFDEARGGSFFEVTNVAPPAIGLQHRDSWMAPAYPAETPLVEIASRTYYYAPDQRQLRRFDGFGTDLPVIDNVVAVAFEHFADPAPPLLYMDPDHPETINTSYGPPPPHTVGEDAGFWPPGENCVFVRDGDSFRPRLEWLGPPESGLVPLTSSMLTDGPWCPGAGAPNRFDADLLRVRRVRVRLRLQAGDPSLRGQVASTTERAWFRVAGTARDPYRLVPDLEVQFDVAPRNLNLAR